MVCTNVSNDSRVRINVCKLSEGRLIDLNNAMAYHCKQCTLKAYIHDKVNLTRICYEGINSNVLYALIGHTRTCCSTQTPNVMKEQIAMYHTRK